MSSTARPSLLAVVNPHARGGESRQAWARIATRLKAGGAAFEELETQGDGKDVQRIVAALKSGRSNRIIAAGGDGTARDVVDAIVQSQIEPAPAVAFAPIGTANNAARAFGLQSCARGSEAAFELAARTILTGRVRRVDLGRVNDRIFLGSVGIGMDADILAMRNRLRGRVPGSLAGYPLYLWCCALNFLRPHGARATIVAADGSTTERRVYNLLVTNTPIYAGEFRFADGECFADGRLDVLPADHVGHYAVSYPAAWPRHLRAQAGRAVRPDSRLFRTERLRLEFESSIAWQIDGEEAPPTARFDIEILPAAIDVCVP